MENRYYTCQYCKKEFIPKRRRVQKFCSSSCRVSSHRLHKSSTVQKKQQEVSERIDKKDKIGVHQIGASTLGTMTGKFVYDKLTPLKNRAATKGDLQLLLSELKQTERYYEVKNLPGRIDGAKPFFDIIEREVIYIKNTNKQLLKV